MDTVKAIMTRRSIRFFSEKKKISNRQLEKIINAGLVAPSAKNCKPWKFLVLQNKKKNEFAEIVESGFAKGKKVEWIDEKIKVNVKDWMKPDPKFIFKHKGKNISPDSSLHVSRVMKEASVIILVFNRAPLSKIKGKGKIDALMAETLSIGASMENMLLAAHALGLGGVWVGDIVAISNEIKKYLKVKENLVGALMIGYPAIKICPRKIVDTKEFVQYKK